MRARASTPVHHSVRLAGLLTHPTTCHPQALLDTLLLELVPALISLGRLSSTTAALSVRACEVLAACAESPREMLTVLQEGIDMHSRWARPGLR